MQSRHRAACANRPLRFLGAVLATGLLLCTGATGAGRETPLYRDPKAPLEQRVEDLLARMTLEEKVAQLTCIWNRKKEILTPAGDFDAVKARKVFPDGIGQVARPSDID